MPILFSIHKYLSPESCGKLLRSLKVLVLLFGLTLSTSVVALPNPPPSSNVSEDVYNELLKVAKNRAEILLEVTGSRLEQWNYINPLVASASPYLMRHSTDPVNWNTWSQKSLDFAAEQKKLIFLSIGFSTCF